MKLLHPGQQSGCIESDWQQDGNGNKTLLTILPGKPRRGCNDRACAISGVVTAAAAAPPAKREAEDDNRARSMVSNSYKGQRWTSNNAMALENEQAERNNSAALVSRFAQCLSSAVQLRPHACDPGTLGQSSPEGGMP